MITQTQIDANNQKAREIKRERDRSAGLEVNAPSVWIEMKDRRAHRVREFEEKYGLKWYATINAGNGDPSLGCEAFAVLGDWTRFQKIQNDQNLISYTEMSGYTEHTEEFKRQYMANRLFISVTLGEGYNRNARAHYGRKLVIRRGDGAEMRFPVDGWGVVHIENHQTFAKFSVNQGGILRKLEAALHHCGLEMLKYEPNPVQ